MKKKYWHKCLAVLAVVSCLFAQAQDEAAKELLADVTYNMPANRVPYVLVYTKSKVEKRFLPVPGITLNVYLDSNSNLLGKATTDANGKAWINFPPAIKSAWDASPTHTIIAVSAPTKEFGTISTEISVTKAKLVIDTLSDGETRSVKVQVMSLRGEEWLPAADVELKLGVKRMGGDLLIGSDESYTTDSTGEVTGEFNLAKLPGDSAGKITLVARVEDNEQFGNLAIEKTVPWGIASAPGKMTAHRTLWATRDMAPIWLLFMAGFVAVVVWGTIIYLVILLLRIRKLGLPSVSAAD